MKIINLLVILFFICNISIAQNVEKGIFKTYEPGYYENTIIKGITDFKEKQQTPKLRATFKADYNNYNFPKNKNDFKTFWHAEPISQGNTSTCWSFATTSFLESEAYRLTKKEVKLSEMYSVYYEFVERAELWVETRGNIYLSEGASLNSVTKNWKKYGIVPYDAFSGLINNQKVYTHENLAQEVFEYLNFVKENQMWNKNIVVETVKNILNFYMGEPPSKITVDGKVYTPLTYMKDYLKINIDDYIDILSYMQEPYYKVVDYSVPDNWFKGNNYYNIPLNEFMDIIKKSIASGYTIAIGGDVSEAGFLAREANAAIIPSFDIPSQYIDENARQFRFSNRTTTDDHGMHIVGYKEMDGKTWYLLKDSGAGSRNGGKSNINFGYYFFHEDYIKLKMMNFIVHKDMLKDILTKF